MELKDAIIKRKSIREYDKEKQVSKEQIEKLVEAAIQAPSWKNSQTARYYAVISQEMREEFIKKCLFGGNVKKAEGAALVVTTFVKNVAGFCKETGEPDNECGNGWGYYDLGLHNENFVLTAKDMGLDTLIMGLRNGDAVRELLGIPENEQIVSVIAVGYAAIDPQKPVRKSVSDILKTF